MITFDNVSFSYGKTPLVNNLCFALPQKGVVGFSGPSGCGKTTLLRLIAHLEKPTSGKILSPAELRLSMVFQEHRLLPWLTAEENVRLVCESDPERATKALEAVELTDAAHQYPDELSGGMQRRVALARALAYDGDVLILDEPFNGLDDSLRDRIVSRILRQFENKLILLVTHSAEEFRLFNCEPIKLTSPLTGNLL